MPVIATEVTSRSRVFFTAFLRRAATGGRLADFADSHIKLCARRNLTERTETAGGKNGSNRFSFKNATDIKRVRDFIRIHANYVCVVAARLDIIDV